MSNLDNNIFQLVRSKASIVDVIAFYLGAKEVIKKGRRYVCRCPFHDDHSPSMSIDPERNLFKCFVDGHGGDVISFVEQYAHLSPIEAVKKVASICNIDLPSNFQNYQKTVPEIESKYPKELEALKCADEIYRLNLISNDGKDGRDYLSKRKISKEVIDHFGIGFALKNPSELIRRLRENKGFDVPTLERCGILSSGSQLVDRYSQRIMFPIQDNDGHIVGYSGRKIFSEQTGGKYINYPETPLFRKSEIMYHFYQAKEEARKVGYIYLVEGFMDVIAYVRAGILSVAGLMGTALTENHIQALKKLHVEVRMALDSDEAGRMGIERAIPELQKAGIPFRVQWQFSKAKDADELLTNFGKDEFLKQANRLFDPVIFLLGRKVGSSGRLNDSKEVLSLLEKVTPYFLNLDPLSQSKDLKVLSDKTGFDEEAILKVFRQGKEAYESEKRKQEQANKDKRDAWKIQRGTYVPYRKRVEPDHLDISTFRLGERYTQLSAYEKMENDIIGYCKEQNLLFPLNHSVPYSDKPGFVDFMKKLCQVEAGLILVLSQRRCAYSIFESTNSSFVIYPLYVLNSLLGSYYLGHVGLESLSLPDYENLLSSLDGKKEASSPALNEPDDDVSDLFDMSNEENEPEKEASADSDDGLEDLFDMGDILSEAVEEKPMDSFSDIHQEDISLIRSLLSSIANITNPLFDSNKFDQEVKQHKKLVDLYRFLKSVSEDKGGVMDKSDYAKYLGYVIEIQKN